MRLSTVLKVIPVGMLALFADVAAAPADDFQALLDEAWEWRLSDDPVFASRLGDRRFNDRWRDLTLDAFEARQETRREFLRRLRQIDVGTLPETERLNYDLFRRQLEDDIDGYRFNDHLMPISQRGGVQSLESTAETVRLETVQDFEDWLARMASVPEVIEQTRDLQEAGRRSGYLPPRILMERIPPQLDQQLVETAEESPFFRAFTDMPE